MLCFVDFMTGSPLQRVRLKPGAVPTVDIDDDTYQTPSKKQKVAVEEQSLEDRSVSPEPEQLQRQDSDMGVQELPDSAPTEASFICDSAVVSSKATCEFNYKIVSADCSNVSCGPDKIVFHTVSTQTPHRRAPYTISDFINRPQHLQDLTGLRSYELFLLIFRSLGPAVYSIKYNKGKVLNVSLEDQLFITLWKLRKATTDVELGIHFGIHHTVASNIFNSFVKFMADQWGKLNLWPTRELVDYYMPAGFKKSFPSTRVIVDGTEFPIQKPKTPTAQQATFSTYKNTNTLKALVGGSPTGLISYVSECYGGSVSDRQITERSSLLDLCQKGDSIMADRGFNVQDLFASRGVAINMPDFLKGRDHLPGTVIMKDRKLASKRVHIERLIGLTKTYKILEKKLQHCYVHMGSELFFVCVMLTNFKENIVGHDA